LGDGQEAVASRTGIGHDGRVPPPVDPPIEVAPLFAAERVKLIDLLGGLGKTDWHRPTPCPQWTVLGLACHLLGGDLGLLARRRDRHFGTPPPERATEDEFIAWLDDLQLEWVRAARRLSPRLVTELLAWTGPKVVETFQAEDPRLVAERVSWAGPQAAPVWLDQLRELSEYWIHRQQLLQALDRASDLDPALLGPILFALRWAYPYRLAGIAAADQDTVRITVEGPVNACWFLVATGNNWDFEAEPGLRTVATMSVTTDQAWRLLSNNLPHDALEDLNIAGDPGVVDVLRNTRAIIGHPR
jgi:uncharacterized protein (TIGR03083 family)